MKVSIITPTFQREERLAALYEIFDRQTHVDKELLVYDDSSEPSRVMQTLSDARVRYFYSKSRLTQGDKRDRLVRESSGDIVVQFDDDDYYAPQYVERMVSELADCDLVKLSKWFLAAADSGECFYWDTTEVRSQHYLLACGESPQAIAMDPSAQGIADWTDRMLWGYGFSYAFRRDVYKVAQFDPSADRKQDYPFIIACRHAKLRLRAIADVEGLAIHVIHDSNMSRAFPNYRVPQSLIDSTFGAEALTLCGVKRIGDAVQAHPEVPLELRSRLRRQLA